MNAKEQLKSFKETIDLELKHYLDKKVSEAEKISPQAKELMEHISDLTLRGGKRIRAALLYYSYLAHGGTDKKEALKAAMSMELSETYLLIHDDIMDNDSLRRGGITIHESYKHLGEERYHEKISPRHFGQSMAILAGDIACALSNEIITDLKLDPAVIIEASKILNGTYAVEGYGQALDIILELKNTATKDEVIQVQQLKTVPYTFDAPVRIGAVLAGADAKKVSDIAGYTVPLGTAFQIQDDVLGMFGSVEKLGKPVTSDLKEGKKTLLILSALEKGDPEQREIILTNLGNKRASINSLKAVRKVIEDTWSLAESKRLASNLVQEAINHIADLRLESEGKDFLLGIADYMIQREY